MYKFVKKRGFSNFKEIKEYEKVLFILKALGHKTSNRQAFTHIVVEKNNVLFSTDGRRAHKTTLDREIKEGFYEVLKSGNTIVLFPGEIQHNYPQYKKLFEPIKKKLTTISLSSSKPSVVDEQYCKLIRLIDKHEGIQRSYFLDVFYNSYEMDVYYTKGQPIYFKNKENEGLIMQLRITT
jgi:hypothetical protein